MSQLPVVLWAGLILMLVAALVKSFSLPIAASLVQGWVWLLTLGLPSKIKSTRRTEIESDLWEHQQEARCAGYAPYEMASQIVLRLVIGMPADVTWRLKQVWPDYSLLAAAVLLTAFGLYALPYDLSIRHAMFGVSGLAAVAYFARLDYRQLRYLATPMMVFALLGLLLVLTPGVGAERDGVRRWLEFGPVILQPSEFAKLAVIIYTVTWLTGSREKIEGFTLRLLPFALMMSVVGGLVIVQPDIGTAMILVLTLSTLYFVAGMPLSHIVLLMVSGGVVSYAMVLFQGDRLAPLDSLASIEVFPQVTGDMSAIVAAKVGVIGIAFIVALYLVLLYWGVRISMAARDQFGTLLGVGLTCWIGYQTVLNVGGVAGVVPLAGVPLPFISYGGSSLIALLSAVGVLMSISRFGPLRPAAGVGAV